MDEKWFKAQQKRAGVTAEDIARIMGRDRSAVSHIYTGRRQMSLPWARAFAEALRVPLDEVLAHAGVIEGEERAPIRMGVADGDVAPYAGVRETARPFMASVGGDRPGVEAWTVATSAMQIAGYLPGDHILVDRQQSETCRAGDAVIAQCYDLASGAAQTVFRLYEPPVLVAASARSEDQGVRVVDGRNVLLLGRVVASWREDRRRG
jgi:transcriptional regulator with XRE-family HTH domain